MKHRLTFAGKKFIRMGTLLLGVSLVTFLLMSASPLDPLQTNVGETALGSMSREQVENLRAYWGVDTPAAERYLGWLGNALRGDLGESLPGCCPGSWGLLLASFPAPSGGGFRTG